MYLDWSEIWGYNCNITAVVGARGIGKTYGVKRKIIKDFIHKGKKFIWIRDTEMACDELRIANGVKFFVDVQKEFKQLEGAIKGDEIHINGKLAGYLMPMSTYYKYKGNSYEDVETIIFDEFIAEKGQNRSAYRPQAFLNTIETIGRLRDNYRVILLANALNRGDDILQILGFKINDYGFYVDRDRSIVLLYSDNNPAFNDARKLSISGKLMQGTAYEENIANGVFDDDADIYFDKRPAKCKIGLILHSSTGAVRLYYSEDGVFVSRDFNPETNKTYRVVTNIKNVDTTKTLIPNDMLESIKTSWKNGSCRFEDAYVRSIFIDCMERR